ncbi:hypothetical protein BOX15_Mlig021745g1, partial [Macrostomum lignano]
VAKKLKMGRKKSDKSARSEEQEDKVNESYQPTGNFQSDFVELCKEMKMYRPPPVFLRPKRPSSPIQNEQQTQAPTNRKAKEDKKASMAQQMFEPEEETPEEKAVIEQLGFKPKTFTVKYYLDLMKPCVHIDLENPDKPDTVSEVHAKNWKLELPMLKTLGRCFEKLNRLHTIVFWRVAASAEVIAELAELLRQLDSVRCLSLEANGHVTDENYADLIRVDSNLTKLQLRFNQITDAGAARISEQLSGLRDPPSKLVSLDLSSNCVQDGGATALAQALRTNRTLIHLSLSNNRVSDRGATALAESCSRFYLTHEETVERRRLLSTAAERRTGLSPESCQSRPSSSAVTPPPSRRGAADRPVSVRSGQEKLGRTGGTGKTPGKGKKDDKAKPEEKAKNKAQKEDSKAKGKGAQASEKDSKSSAATLKSGKGKGGNNSSSSGGGRVKVSTPLQLDQEESQPPDSDHPLLERVDTAYAPGYLLVPGNHVLALLNLSRNQITDKGVLQWKTAISYQLAYMSKQKVNGTGLMKLLLQGNPFSTESESYRILQQAMSSRDPVGSSSNTSGNVDQ